MSRIVQPLRSPGGAGRLDLSNLRALLKDRRLWAQLGVVTAHDSGPHWEKKDGQILVQVQTAPRGLELTCRLGAAFGSLGAGGWRVPAPGTEVAVLVPEGEVDFIPMIVACLDSGAAPERASDTRTILVAHDAIEVTAPKVTLGPKPGEATGCVVVEETSVKLGGESAVSPVFRADLLGTGLDTFLLALNTYAAAIAGIADPSGTATSALAAAVTTFQTAIEAAKSTVTKTL